jgi:hypothetical protein
MTLIARDEAATRKPPIDRAAAAGSAHQSGRAGAIEQRKNLALDGEAQALVLTRLMR